MKYEKVEIEVEVGEKITFKKGAIVETRGKRYRVKRVKYLGSGEFDIKIGELIGDVEGVSNQEEKQEESSIHV